MTSASIGFLLISSGFFACAVFWVALLTWTKFLKPRMDAEGKTYTVPSWITALRRRLPHSKSRG